MTSSQHDGATASRRKRPAYTRGPIELRVHGVSGTPPESLLDRQAVVQEGGDKIAGFYRPRLLEERRDSAPHPFLPGRPDAPELEGYNWGGLTSGSPARALWLFLLPFTLVNLAPRARPLPAKDNEALRYLTWLFSRWLALTLTLLLVATAAGIGLNMAAWQCAYSDACKGAARNGLVGGVFGSFAHRHPEVMLLGGAAVPLLMLFVLWFVSKRTIDRYESVAIEIPDTDESDYDEHQVEANLDSPWMWRNQKPVRRIRAVHLQAGIALVFWIAIAAVSPISVYRAVLPWNWGEPGWRTLLVALIAGAVLVFSFAVLGVRSFVGHQYSPAWQATSGVVWALLCLAGVLGSWDLLTGTITKRGTYDHRGYQAALPGYDQNLWRLVVVMFALLLALIVVVVVQAWKPTRHAPDGSDHVPLRPGLLGCAGAAIATAAVLVGAVFSSSAYTVAAAWLNTGSLKPSLKQVSSALKEFAVPDTFRMATFVFVLAVGVAVVVVLFAVAAFVVAFGFTLQGFGLEARVPTRLVRPGSLLRDYGPGADQDTDDPDHNGRRRAVERAMFFGALLEKGLVVVGILVSLGVLMAFVGASQLVFEWGWIEDVRGRGATWVPKAEAWGAYGAVLLLLALIGLTSLAFRVPATRRGVGIIWDVASFWPRACHPLAAPCYAERTVPDLVTRLHYLRTVDQRPVVLAGHSQGTVLSAAALLNLKGHGGTDEAMNGISLLTFGCVLRRLYGRYFPVYFGPHRLHQLQVDLSLDPDHPEQTRWINLWRYTDYLGGQVTAGPPQLVPSGVFSPPPDGLIAAPPSTGPSPWEWHAPDPPTFNRRLGETTYSLPGRHSNFWADQSGVYQLAVGTLAADLTTDPSP